MDKSGVRSQRLNRKKRSFADCQLLLGTVATFAMLKESGQTGVSEAPEKLVSLSKSIDIVACLIEL